MANKVQIDSNRTIGLKVSSQSIPIFCANPWATRRALHEHTDPSGPIFLLKHSFRIDRLPIFWRFNQSIPFHIAWLPSTLLTLVHLELLQQILVQLILQGRCSPIHQDGQVLFCPWQIFEVLLLLQLVLCCCLYLHLLRFILINISSHIIEINVSIYLSMKPLYKDRAFSVMKNTDKVDDLQSKNTNSTNLLSLLAPTYVSRVINTASLMPIFLLLLPGNKNCSSPSVMVSLTLILKRKRKYILSICSGVEIGEKKLHFPYLWWGCWSTVVLG